jgi:hypothetical protein
VPSPLSQFEPATSTLDPDAVRDLLKDRIATTA